jgi:enoyl-CoA hydratase
MEYKNILIKKADLTGWIIINRPEKLNVLGRAALAELRDAFGEMEKDPEVGVVILAGAGDRAFSAGVDISEFPAMDVRAALEYAAEGQALTLAIEYSKKPVIAALNGLVVGGGLELALACHIRLAS